VVQLSPDPLIRLDRPARQSLLSRLEASPARRSARAWPRRAPDGARL